MPCQRPRFLIADDSLDLDLVVPPRVPRGEPVRITLRVKNRTRSPVDLSLRGRTITFDVVVAGPDGIVVWQRLANEVVPAILHLRTLGPSERWELETVWAQQSDQGTSVEPGAYTVRALVLVEGDPLETRPVPLRIVETVGE